ADACRPLEFPKPATADAAEELVRRFEAEQRVRLTELVSKLSAISARPPAAVGELPDLEIKDLISAAEGAILARRAKSTMNNWCRANAIDGEKGFAARIRKRWFVSRSRLLRHLASGSSD